MGLKKKRYGFKLLLLLMLLGDLWSIHPERVLGAPDPGQQLKPVVKTTSETHSFSTSIGLTQAEINWLSAHPEIRVHNEMSWAPINFNRHGKPTGYSIDVMNLVAKKVGFRVKYVSGPSWDEFVTAIKEHRLDVMLNIVKSKERHAFLNFTDSYMEFSQALFTRKGFPRVTSIDDLKGKRFAIPKGFYVEELIKKHPDITIVPVADTAGAIRAISNDKADIMLDVMPVVNYLARKMLVTNLKSGGSLGLNEDQAFKVSIGVRKDWGVFRDILQKGLAVISERELYELQNRWFLVADDQSSNAIVLTQAEKRWLSKHPVIRTSSEPDYAPFDFVEDGKSVGFSVDYLNLLAERAGLKIEYVQDTWSNLVKMAEKKEVDLLHTIFRTSDRESFLRFTKPYKSVVNFIFVRDDIVGVNSLADLAGKTVALPEGDSITELLIKEVPGAKIVFMDQYLQILKSIALGRTDATVMDSAVANYLIRENTLTNIRPVAEANIDSGERDPKYRFGVRKDWPELHSILEKAMGTISREDIARLEARWFGLTKVWKRTSIELTAEESSWLASHPVIRVHNEKEWPPFNYFEYGKPRGLSIDYMNLLAATLGLKVDYATGPGWNEFLHRIQNGELDVMLNIVRTQDREKFLLYTPPYIRNPNVIVSSANNPYSNLDELSGKTVAVVKGFFHGEVLDRSFPGIKQLVVSDVLESLKAVSFGRADATVGEKAVVEHIIERNLLTSLKISGEIDIGNPDLTNLRIGVRKDWPLLHSILIKAMAEVSPQQMSQIQKKWIQSDRVEQKKPSGILTGVSRFMLLSIIGIVVAFGIILFVISWLVSRSKQRDISELYGSSEMKRAGLIVLALAVGIIVLMVSFRLIQFKEDIRSDLSDRLETVLEMSHQTLNIWIRGKKGDLRVILESARFKQHVKELLTLRRDKKSLEKSAALARLRSFFHENRNRFGNLQFYVISPDMVTIGSMNDRDLGKKDIVGENHQSLLNTVFLGDYVFIPPTRSNVFSPEEKRDDMPDRPAMFFAGPIISDTGLVSAIAVVAADPLQEFSRVAQAARMGRTGETYFFDDKALLMTESRFRNELQADGLIGIGESSILNVRLADSGANQDRENAPLTYMANDALAWKNGYNINGYRDYRGKIVAGAWLWDHDLNLGIATEIDLAEALNEYLVMRNTLVSTLGITVLIALILTGFSLWIGQSATRSLGRSRDQLEVRVEERTGELARLEKRFRDLIESAPDSMIIVDEKGVITLVNAQTEKLFGYSRDEMVGQEIEFVIPPRFRADHPAKRNGFIQTALVDPIEVKRELIGFRKSGEEFPVEVSLSPLKTDEGLLVSAAVRDITDRRMAQDALQESEERNRLVLDNVGEGIFGVNLDGRIIFVNPAVCKLLDYTFDELIGEKIHDLIHHTRKDGSFYPVDECPMKKAYTMGKVFTIDDEVLWRKDGSPIDVFYTSTPIVKGGEIEGAVITFRDVTEKRLAEEKRMESESRFRAYFEYGQVGMCVTHPDKGWLEVNKRFLQMLGHSREELEPLTWADLTHPEDLAGDVVNFNRVMNGEINNYVMDKRFVRKDGEIVFINMSVACVRDKKGRVEKFLASMLDITESKKNEAELQQRFEELERFRRLATGRELKMIDLKKEINGMMLKSGSSEKYKIH